MFEQEERRENEVQDSFQMTGSRIFEREGPRRKTGAELTMKKLKRHDQPIVRTQHQNQSFGSPQRNSHQSSVLSNNIVDGLISGAHLSAAELTKFVIKRDSQFAAQEIEIIEMKVAANSTPQRRSNSYLRKRKHSLTEE